MKQTSPHPQRPSLSSPTQLSYCNKSENTITDPNSKTNSKTDANTNSKEEAKNKQTNKQTNIKKRN